MECGVARPLQIGRVCLSLISSLFLLLSALLSLLSSLFCRLSSFIPLWSLPSSLFSLCFLLSSLLGTDYFLYHFAFVRVEPLLSWA